MTTTTRGPDFSAYIRDERMVVQIISRGQWLSVTPACVSSIAVAIAEDVVAAGQHVDYVRIVGVEFAPDRPDAF